MQSFNRTPKLAATLEHTNKAAVSKKNRPIWLPLNHLLPANLHPRRGTGAVEGDDEFASWNANERNSHLLFLDAGHFYK